MLKALLIFFMFFNHNLNIYEQFFYWYFFKWNFLAICNSCLIDYVVVGLEIQDFLFYFLYECKILNDFLYYFKKSMKLSCKNISIWAQICELFSFWSFRNWQGAVCKVLLYIYHKSLCICLCNLKISYW
jgi:hypothetical protein